MKKKTIKNIAFDCADSFNIKHKEKSILYKGFRETGDYWGDVPIDDKLVKTVLQRLNQDKVVEEQQLTAIYSFESWIPSISLFGTRHGHYSQYYCSSGNPTFAFLIHAIDDNLNIQHRGAVFLKRSDPDIDDYEKIHISQILSMLDYFGIKDTGGDFVEDEEDCVILINANQHLFDQPIILHFEYYKFGGRGSWGYSLTNILKRALKLCLLSPDESLIAKDLIKSIEDAHMIQERENEARHDKAVAQFVKAVNKLAVAYPDRQFLIKQ